MFKVGQVWETRNEKGRGAIAEISGYNTDYPIKFVWDEPLPGFVQDRPVTLDDEAAHRWDLFRADGGFSMVGSTHNSEWDLVRLVETPAPVIKRYDMETDRIIAEEAGINDDDDTAWEALEKRGHINAMAVSFAEIGAQARPDLPAADIARCAFDLAEAMITEQIKRGYR
jgi:hypothetical protein